MVLFLIALLISRLSHLSLLLIALVGGVGGELWVFFFFFVKRVLVSTCVCVSWGPGLQISGQIAGVTCGPFPVLASLHLGEFHSHLCLSKVKSIVHVLETMANSR